MWRLEKSQSSRFPSRGRGSGASASAALGFLGAVAWRDVLLLGVRRCGLLDHRAHKFSVGLDPVGDDDPLVAVPLLELDGAATLVIQAGELDRLHEADRAELF